MSTGTQGNKSGFTIVELLISTAVFSLILVAVSVTVVEISRLYYKGTILTRTQDTGRNLIENVSRPIQLEGADIVGASLPSTLLVDETAGWPDEDGVIQNLTVRSICIGTTRYTFTLNKQVRAEVSDPDDHVRHALWQDTVTSSGFCTKANIPNLTLESPTPNGRDVLTERMRVTAFDVSSDDGILYKVSIGVMYGDRELMLPGREPSGVWPLPTQCATELAGSQWCAHANYETTVMKRISGGI